MKIRWIIYLGGLYNHYINIFLAYSVEFFTAMSNMNCIIFITIYILTFSRTTFATSVIDDFLFFSSIKINGLDL